MHLAQLDNGQVLYVSKRNAVQPVDMYAQAGKVGPAYCTGIGKAMLAHLPQAERDRALQQQSFHAHTDRTLSDPAALVAELARIARRGFARDREEHEPGIVCVAVPVLGRGGRLLGGLSVTGTTRSPGLAALEAHVPALQATAAAIAQEAEAWRFPQADPIPQKGE